MAVETHAVAQRALTPRTLRIEFLFLDLTTCTRCLGANRSLEAALEVVGETLAAAEVEVQVDKVLVGSEAQARALRFESSPTIRVDGRDVALELRESSCGSEACTDGCGENVACRVWVWRGREYTEPPVAMIVDAVLRGVYAGGAADTTPPKPEGYAVPENLARFFAGKAASTETACCTPGEQKTCCAADAKAQCCGDTSAEACGCQ